MSVPGGRPDDEVAGHADPLQPQAEPPADLELDDGERDREPDPARRATWSSWLLRTSWYSAARGPREAGFAVQDAVEPGRARLPGRRRGRGGPGRGRSARRAPRSVGSKSSSGRPSAAMQSAPTARSISASGRATSRAESRPIRRARDLAGTHPAIVATGRRSARRSGERRPGPHRSECSASAECPVPSPDDAVSSCPTPHSAPGLAAPARPRPPGCPTADAAAADRRRVGRSVRRRCGSSTSSRGSSAAGRSASTTSSTA